MKRIITVNLLILSTMSFQSLSATNSSIARLNSNITECFEQTHKGELASKWACNSIIKSDVVSRKNRAVAYHNRGVINLNKGDVKGAFRDFKRAIRFNPELGQTKQVIALLDKKINKNLG